MQSVRTYKSSLGRHRVRFPTQGSRSYRLLHSLVQVRTQSHTATIGAATKKKKKEYSILLIMLLSRWQLSVFSVFLLYNGSHIHQKESRRKGIRLKGLYFLIAKYTNDRSHQNNITRNAMHVLKMPNRNLQHIDPVFGWPKKPPPNEHFFTYSKETNSDRHKFLDIRYGSKTAPQSSYNTQFFSLFTSFFI